MIFSRRAANISASSPEGHSSGTVEPEELGSVDMRRSYAHSANHLRERDNHPRQLCFEAMAAPARPEPKRPLERLHERIVVGDRGWFFAAIADKVAERRVQMGMSQRELAVLCGTTQSAIARLERGGRPPRIDTLLRIAEALDCELLVELVPHKK